jgi:hypothetical protein
MVNWSVICATFAVACASLATHHSEPRPVLTGRGRSRLVVAVCLSYRHLRPLQRPCSSMAVRRRRNPVNATEQRVESLCAPLGALRGVARACCCHRRAAAWARRWPWLNAKVPKSWCQKREVGPSECEKSSSPVHMMSAQGCRPIDVVFLEPKSGDAYASEMGRRGGGASSRSMALDVRVLLG